MRSQPEWLRTSLRRPTSTPRPVESRNETSSRSTTSRAWPGPDLLVEDGAQLGGGVDVDLSGDRDDADVVLA